MSYINSLTIDNFNRVVKGFNNLLKSQQGNKINQGGNQREVSPDELHNMLKDKLNG